MGSHEHLWKSRILFSNKLRKHVFEDFLLKFTIFLRNIAFFSMIQRIIICFANQ